MEGKPRTGEEREKPGEVVEELGDWRHSEVEPAVYSTDREDRLYVICLRCIARLLQWLEGHFHYSLLTRVQAPWTINQEMPLSGYPSVVE